MKFLYMTITVLLSSGALAFPALFDHRDASCSLGLVKCPVYCQLNGYTLGTCNEATKRCQCSVPVARNELDPYYGKGSSSEAQNVALKESVLHSITMPGNTDYDGPGYNPVSLNTSEDPVTETKHTAKADDIKQ
ncbi:hypothetical protein BCR43DRAFT_505400 [Syncephalastrum racemosum]|uniref:Invertebrate defensins family profile domain-containing protein n=1 Tax=Syncephalastrum racemosum TaxID=13706 RepID=A0A1X2HCP0_SYNRA|nr:hypothetical protein BCR43DRAFT_505400 [Syncephalastrum racemosum]